MTQPKPTVTSLSISPTHVFSKTSLPSITLLAGLGIAGDCHAGETVQHRSRLHIRPVPPNLRQVHLIHQELFEEVAPARKTPIRWRLLVGLMIVICGSVIPAVGQELLGPYRVVDAFRNRPTSWEVWGKTLLTMGLRVMPFAFMSIIMIKICEQYRAEKARGSLEAGYVVKPGDLGENITTRGLDILSLPRDTLLVFVNPGSDDEKDQERPTVRVTGLRNPCPQIDKFANGLRERCLIKESGEVVGRKAGIMSVVEVGGEVRVGAEIVVRLPEGDRVVLGCV
jgi:hypothetical protein